MASNGTETRFDNDLGGNHVAREVDKARACTHDYSYKGKRRFCETCRQYKPKGSLPAMKGWKCLECARE